MEAQVACCADYEPIVDNWALVESYRGSINGENPKDPAVRGSPGYCTRTTPCRRYDGSCDLFEHFQFRDATCIGSDFCAADVGAKYGMKKRTAVCLPEYFVNQIAFTPREMTKSQPATFLFTQRGDIELPKTHATVRIVKGDNIGCMGVWDSSTEIAADSGVLLTQGGWRVRPLGYEQFRNVNSGDCSSGICYEDLPYTTEPYLEWKDVTIDEGFNFPGTGFEESTHHVCLCDLDLDCLAPWNWHDLGERTG
jgi:hypothetical protein